MKYYVPLIAGLVIAGLLLLSQQAVAENWPGWRGPRGDGTSTEPNPPVEWDGAVGTNIAWKTAIPGVGHSQPITWDDRVFLTSCLIDSTERILICLNRSDGRPIWQRTVAKAILETKHQLNSYASGTPVTDGRTIYVTFLLADGHEIPAPNVGSERNVTPGEMLVVAYDFDGTELWRVTPGSFISAHGYCTSPVIFEDLLIVNGDHDGQSFVVALNRRDGTTVWKVPREYGIRSYCTPLIRDVAGKTQLVMTGSKRVVSMNPRTGENYWLIEGPTEQFVSSMVFDGRQFYLTAGYPTHHVMAIRPDGSGDVTKTHVSWETTESKCYVPSPVLAGNRLYVADDRGTVSGYDTASGRRIWQERLGKQYSASLLAAGDLVYFVAEDGVTAVVRSGDKPEILHRNALGEFVSSSAAISNGQLLIRGEQHLFAIGSDLSVQR